MKATRAGGASLQFPPAAREIRPNPVALEAQPPDPGRPAAAALPGPGTRGRGEQVAPIPSPPLAFIPTPLEKPGGALARPGRGPPRLAGR
jgi:hypothetical protein